MPDLCWISSLRLECNQWKLKIELKEAFVWDLRKFQKVTKINLMTTEEQENCILLFYGKMYLFYFCIWIFLSFCLCTLFWHISHYGALWTLLRWKQIHKVSFLKKRTMSVSPVDADDGGCNTSVCTLQQEGSALHNFGGTSHPGSS